MRLNLKSVVVLRSGASVEGCIHAGGVHMTSNTSLCLP